MGKIVPFAVLVAVASILFLLFSRDTFDPAVVRDTRVVITGASAGIGEQLAYQYAKLGARIVLTARRANVLEQVALKCKELGAEQVDSVAADMAIPQDRTKVAEAIQRHLGGLDHLILNHAIYDMRWWTGSPENLTTLEQYLNVNFLSYVDLTSKTMSMLATSKGSIGIVSSILGKIGRVQFVPYAASKFALQGFYSSYRQELNYRATGISVTMCILGLIDTDNAMSVWRDVHPEWNTAAIAGSAEMAAVAILRGVVARKYEIYYPWLASIFTNVQKVIPGYLEDFATTMSGHQCLARLFKVFHDFKELKDVILMF